MSFNFFTKCVNLVCLRCGVLNNVSTLQSRFRFNRNEEKAYPCSDVKTITSNFIFGRIDSHPISCSYGKFKNGCPLLTF